MRLLNANNFTLSSFDDEDTLPPYAILSHTWGDDELTFKDLTDLSRSQFSLIERYKKVEKCCAEALKWKLEWVWIDTCSIDSSSSAELSEAINSMYQWYRNAAVCFAYLSDVSAVKADFDPGNLAQSSRKSSFNTARWFTRGWCLQELLAPRNMYFYNRHWERIGSKNSLKSHISHITGIDEYGLFIPDLTVLSVAHRMSWAARRHTTRPEDIAYCLLGIFNINMPLLYGEGQVKAFGRLQEEIIQRTDDHSIFAWETETSGLMSLPIDFKNDMVGVLAPHPCCFTNRKINLQELPRNVEPLAITGRGLRAQVPLVRIGGREEDYLAVIGCSQPDTGFEYLAIPVTRLNKTSDVYRRTSPDICSVIRVNIEDLIPSTIFLLRYSRPTHLEDKNTTQVWLSLLEMEDCVFEIIGAYPAHLWNRGRRVFAFAPSDFRNSPEMRIEFVDSSRDYVFRLTICLDQVLGRSTLALISPETISSNAGWNVELSNGPWHYQTELELRPYNVAASIDHKAVFGQELHEVKIVIKLGALG
jgi:hypothetical protein